MRNGFEAINEVDEDGNPAGGKVHGVGFFIKWQDGPLGRTGTAERVEPNGAFVEDVIGAALQRIEHYQTAAAGKCAENENAILHLESALAGLDDRTKRRTQEGVEGTHEGS